MTAQGLGKLGKLVTRLARNHDEVKAAQSVRFRVFCEEMGGVKSRNAELSPGLEIDGHDALCDHLLVLENDAETTEKIVGTQRFYLKSSSDALGSLYSQAEFDVEALIIRHPQKRFMELGRSCILPEYRNKRTLELLWQGTWAYAVENKVDVMIGCASFPTVDIREIETEIGFLVETSPALEDWHVKANSKHAFKVSPTPNANISPKAVLRKLPPLVKGYLRLGALFSDEVVLDEDFGTIDILVVLPVERISSRYLRYYGETADKHRG